MCGLVLTVDAPKLGGRLTSIALPRNASTVYLTNASMEEDPGASTLVSHVDSNVDPDLTPDTVRWLAVESGLLMCGRAFCEQMMHD